MKLTLLIKNMVCQHCVHCVRNLLEAMPGVDVRSVMLGNAVVEVADGEESDMVRFSEALATEGFELIQSREAEIVEMVKRVLIEISRREGGTRENLPEILAEKIPMSYATLSRLFSEIEGRTIENYFMNLRVERVKELIKYGRQSMSEIAYETGYSSVAHLSRQFKQLTGMTPTQFRSMGMRKPLQEV